MSSPVDQIKERLSIVDIVSSYLKLEKAGRNFKARCPFHTEKSPSFFVSPERETFHCFGCDKGGDIFTFVEEIEGVDFSGALKILADRAGVILTAHSKEESDERKRLFELLEDITLHWTEKLLEAKDVLEYLTKRGLTEETIRSFRLGYAPDGWSDAAAFLKSRGWKDEELFTGGIAIRATSGKIYDRFRGRIMFPIADASGRVIGFSGRIFSAADPKAAKYVNSPETPLFHKSRVLYGYDKAKLAIRQMKSCVLVEGQMDLLLSHQAGATNTIATSGTALTTDQLTFLKRLTDTVVFAYDADVAGLNASRRGIDLALEHGFTVSVARLPKGKDPADVVLEDKDKWHEILKAREHAIEFYINVLKEHTPNEHIFRRKVEEVVVPYIAKIGRPIEQAHFVVRVAEALKLDAEPVWRAVKEASKASTEKVRTSASTPSVVSNVVHEKALHPALRRLLGIVLWQKSCEKPVVTITEVGDKVKNLCDISISGILEAIDEKGRERMIFEAEMYYKDSEGLLREVDELLLSLREAELKKHLESAHLKLHRAELKGEIGEINEALRAYASLTREYNEIAEVKKARAKEL
ncbi:MAG: DNA primase [Parcubacteria group bacterium]|nr:DNA primase [Parcubacteria group bacterium]